MVVFDARMSRVARAREGESDCEFIVYAFVCD
jgi:hypothetical protein